MLLAGLAMLALTAGAQTPGAAADKAPEVIAMQDAALGGVTFQHKAHVARAGEKCAACHHASKPEKPETKPNQACRDCHLKPPAAGMKTSRQAAFHNSTAQSGVCIGCHRTEAAAGKKAPLKCAGCHVREARKVEGGQYGQPRHSAAGVPAMGLGGHGADSLP